MYFVKTYAVCRNFFLNTIQNQFVHDETENIHKPRIAESTN